MAPQPFFLVERYTSDDLSEAKSPNSLQLLVVDPNLHSEVVQTKCRFNKERKKIFITINTTEKSRMVDNTGKYFSIN